ncbi:MAG TPA: VIT domain-containing protein [Chlamydiales bacterium]|nr:VIT domain-containing protein [Chlamydiales bacterium]
MTLWMFKLCEWRWMSLSCFPFLTCLAGVRRATVIQTYVSNATTHLDVKYVFPLPPDASVCAFKAVINGQRSIKGVVKEKEKAKAEYEEAVSKGKTAALLEQSNVESKHRYVILLLTVIHSFP